MVVTWVQAFLAASTVLGVGHHAGGPGCCDVCGVEKAEVLATIARLQTCPDWRVRDDAAHDLRKFDWRCHPEIVAALSVALLKDCEEEVREEAAQSLSKMRTCLPIAHEALSKAARCDPDCATRLWARWGLKTFGRRCAADCDVCGPSVVGGGPPPLLPGPVPSPDQLAPTVPGPALGPGEVLAPLPSDSGVAPPLEAPALPPGSSPFSTSPTPPPPPPSPGLEDEPALRPLPPTSSEGRARRTPLLGRLFGRRPRSEGAKERSRAVAGPRAEERDRDVADEGQRVTELLPLERPARD
jgi:hypothetical protein